MENNMKAEIQVITNSKGSGDWVKVFYCKNDLIFEGHSIKPADLVQIINSFYSDNGAELVEVNDQQMEEM